VVNFKFKIIFKISTKKLGVIAKCNISIYQNGFVRSYRIKDRICITSKSIHILPKQVHEGNLAIKIDIKKPLTLLIRIS